MSSIKYKPGQYQQGRDGWITDLGSGRGSYWYHMYNEELRNRLAHALNKPPAFLYTPDEMAAERAMVLSAANRMAPTQIEDAALFSGEAEAYAMLRKTFAHAAFSAIAGVELPFLPNEVLPAPTLLTAPDVVASLAPVAPGETRILLYAPVMNHDGVFTHIEGMTALLQAARKLGYLLLAVEGMGTLGRSGKWLGTGHYTIQPDFWVLNSLITDGTMSGALLLSTKKTEMAYTPQPLLAAGFWAFTQQLQQPAVAQTIGEITEILQHTQREWLQRFQHLQIQQLGCMLCVQTPHAAGLVELLLSNGVLVHHSAHAILIMPPLTTSAALLRYGLDKLLDLMSTESI